MNKIIITLEITDPETVQTYLYSNDLVEADLLHGTLLQKCNVVNVEYVEGKK